MRRAGIALVVVLAGCGGGGLEGTLEWAQPPSMSGRSLNGSIQNRTSHAVNVDSKGMRLLDDHGRKVAGRIRVNGGEKLAAGASTSLTATWKAGKPVRIDYGAGTLALPSA